MAHLTKVFIYLRSHTHTELVHLVHIIAGQVACTGFSDVHSYIEQVAYCLVIILYVIFCHKGRNVSCVSRAYSYF